MLRMEFIAKIAATHDDDLRVKQISEIDTECSEEKRETASRVISRSRADMLK